MSTKAADAGKTFLTGVFAKISDPEKRAQVEAIFNDPAAADALVAIGAGALAQSDINRKYDEIKAKETAITEDYQKLNDWYTTKQADLDELAELRAGKTKPGDPSAPRPPVAPDLSKYVSQEDFLASMNEAQRGAANYLALQNVLTLKHYEDFKEIIDARELLKDPNLGKAKADGGIYGITDAYTTKYAEKIAARAQQLDDARINQRADAIVAEKMKGLSMQQPFVLKGAPSALDLLESGAEMKPDQYSAAAAAEEYARLQQARGA